MVCLSATGASRVLTRVGARALQLACLALLLAVLAAMPDSVRVVERPAPAIRVGVGEGLLEGWRQPPSRAALPDTSHPRGSPYPAGGRGYDLSYPSCGKGQPVGADFAVIGINGGRAFTRNPCLAQQWAAAAPRRSLYLNTGYRPDYAVFVTADCGRQSRYRRGSVEQRVAYAIGCSEADFSLAYLRRAVPGARSAALWLDVET